MWAQGSNLLSALVGQLFFVVIVLCQSISGHDKKRSSIKKTTLPDVGWQMISEILSVCPTKNVWHRFRNKKECRTSIE